jgi:hypothetical protein
MFRFIFAIIALLHILVSTGIAGPLPTCDEAGLRAAINQGGVVTFPCDATISISSPITISNQVTLDATGRSVVLTGNNSTRLFQIAPGGTLDLIHLTLADGSAIRGGAILNESGRVVTANCLFQNNHATGAAPDLPAEGGAIYNAGELTITNCEFHGNIAAVSFIPPTTQPGVLARGGAIKTDALVTIANTLFIMNSTIAGAGAAGDPNVFGKVYGGAGGPAYGGALYIGSRAEITSCTFSNNITRGGQGGPGGSSYFLTTLPGAPGGAAYGAAVFMNTTSPEMQLIGSCTFIANSSVAGLGGIAYGPSTSGAGGDASGAIHLKSGVLNALNNLWQQNQSVGGPGSEGPFGGPGGFGGGGAILVEAGQLYATNNTFFANQAQGGGGGKTGYGLDQPGGQGGNAFGGAILVKTGITRISHATFALNSIVPGSGGYCNTFNGIAAISARGNAHGAGLGNESGSVSVANSIFSTNYFGAVNENCSGPINDLGFNLSSDWSFPFVMSGVDPKLGAFDFNGGSTKNFALLPDSPAVDFSDPANSPLTDQREISRSAGLAPDAGAYEADAATADDLNLADLKTQIANGGSILITQPGTFVFGQSLNINKNVTIDASQAPVVFDGRYGARLFHVLPGISFTLINATVANSRAVEGAGLFNEGGSVTLVHCTFTNNVAIGSSGAHGTNSAARRQIGGIGGSGLLGRGGAILNTGTLVISNSFFMDNAAIGGRGGDGGIGGDGTYTLLLGYACRYGTSGGSGGAAGSAGNSQGGAIWNSGQIKFINSLVRDNQVVGGVGGNGGDSGHPGCGSLFGLDPAGAGGRGGLAEGGAIYSTAPFQITASTLISNVARGGDGGLGGNLPTLSGSGSAGTGGGGASGFGGAMASRGVAITNVTFAFNIAEGGMGGSGGTGSCSSANGAGGDASAGAIDEHGTNVSQNCTFVGNAAYLGPGGKLTNYCNVPAGTDGHAFAGVIHIHGLPSAAQQLLKGSIIALSNSQTSVIGTLIDNGYNLSDDSQIAFTETTSKRNIDPLLLPLDDSADVPVFRPALNSPARDAIPASLSPPVDQRGVLRPIGPSADIGAIELAMPEIPPQIALNPNETLSLTYKAHPDSDYVLFESFTLDSWTAISTNRATADGSLLFGPIATSAPHKFFLSTGP